MCVRMCVCVCTVCASLPFDVACSKTGNAPVPPHPPSKQHRPMNTLWLPEDKPDQKADHRLDNWEPTAEDGGQHILIPTEQPKEEAKPGSKSVYVQRSIKNASTQFGHIKFLVAVAELKTASPLHRSNIHVPVSTHSQIQFAPTSTTTGCSEGA